MPEAGIKFGQYVLLRRIARGGMAEVFLAQQRGLEGFDRRVAVKRILPHLADAPDFVKMFLGEAKLAAQLTHPNIVHIYEFGKVGNDYFIAMEFVDGVHAGQLFKLGERGMPKIDRLPPTMVARIGADAATALNYAQELRGPNGKPLNLVHRDVSPANLMVSFDGVVKLCDFGIAKAAALSDQLTNPGQVKGKYAYMSPEQTVAAPLDGRSDVFSLAIVLWELLAGKTIVGRGDTVEAMRAIRDGKLEPIERAAPDTPKPLADAIKWALETKREKRATAADLATALEAFIKSAPDIATSMQLASWVRPRFPREPTGEMPPIGTVMASTSTPKTGAHAGTLIGEGTSPTASALPPALIAASRSPSQVDDDAETINMGPPSEIASAIAKRAAERPTVDDAIRQSLRKSPNVIVDEGKLRPSPPRRDPPLGAQTIDAELVDDSVDEGRDTFPERMGPPNTIVSKAPPTIVDPAQRRKLPLPSGSQPPPASVVGPPPTIVAPPPTMMTPPMTASVPSLVREQRSAPAMAYVPVPTPPPTRRPTTVQAAPAGRVQRIVLAIGVLVALMVASFLIALLMRSRREEAPPPPKTADAAVAVAGDAAVVAPPVDAPAPALLEVMTSPGSATITIGGKTYQAPARLTLPPGPYTISAALDGYEVETRELQLRAGEHEVSDITFEHPLATTGFLSIKTTPACDVYDNDKMIGSTPITDIAMKAGTYTLTFRNAQKGAVVRRVTITAGKTTKLSFSL